MLLFGNVSLAIQAMDVFLILLIIAGIVALVFLAVTLAKIIGTLNRIDKILDDTTAPLVKVASDLPELTANIRDILGNVLDITDDLATASPEMITLLIELLQSINLALASASDLVVVTADGITGFIDDVSLKVKAGTGAVKSVLKSVFTSAFRARGSKDKTKTKRTRYYREKEE